MGNLQKDFVPYNFALRMKALGFDEPCLAKYITSDLVVKGCYKDSHILHALFEENEICEAHILVPTFSQAFRWFREKYDWQHSIEPTADQHRFEVGYNYWVWNSKTGEEYHTMPKNRPTGDWEYETYEEAEQDCLVKLIDIIENK